MNLRNTESVRPPFGRDLILLSIHVARKNWSEWRVVFEHQGTIATNPLIAGEYTFASFCKEYSVSRTIRRGTQNEFRLALIDSLSEVVNDDSGRALDRLEGELRPRFGTRGGTRGMVSVLSKVAAFVRPERFVAWDSFAKRGLNFVHGRRANFRFHSYAEYLTAFDQVWSGQAGQQIRDYVTANPGQSSTEREPRFLRRVLDVCLMRHGGRTL